jgi:hypothetical protein
MQLNIKQRFAVVGIYLLLILWIGYYFTNSLEFVVDTNNNLNAVLVATALAFILSSYIAEPYFSKPVDVITRWVAIFLFVIGLDSKECLSLKEYWIVASIVFMALALLLIFIHGIQRIEKYQRIAVDFICKISRPEIVFTLLYFDIVISFFRFYPREYPILIGFGFLLAINKPIVWFVKWVSSFLNYFSSTADAGEFLGRVIGHESADLYKIEIESDNSFRQHDLQGKLVYLENNGNGVVGIVLSEKVLLGKKWLQILSFRDRDLNLISFNVKSLKPLANEKSIFSKTNSVFLLNLGGLDQEVKDLIEVNPIYSNFKNLIGTVWEGSTINQIRFNKLFSDEFLVEKGIGEGSIVQTTIGGREVLYQIIDAKTNEEDLEFKDSHGFTIGTAQKLGKYDVENSELNAVKWLPEIYTPVVLLSPIDINYVPGNFIGKLPNTNYGIAIKYPHELITHNTAILGILGIGKSCLTFELIQKALLHTPVKVVCLDITGQHFNELKTYIASGVDEIDYTQIETQIAPSYTTINKDIDEGGNHKLFKQQIIQCVTKLINTAEDKVLVINPQSFSVSYQVGDVKNKKVGPGQNDWMEVASMRDLSVAEITRLISEVSLDLCKVKGITEDPRLLLVFEEAHSLVPEWNSVANDGDKNATNGTAKVILQGRKYGLGSFVITQRTANISKSILNQCNTIFALRIFDDTGKQFLENYIGSNYSNLLPTLEERHCIAIGKAMKLKQPVIIKLNDMREIKLSPSADDAASLSQDIES